MNSTKKLWRSLAMLLVASFATLNHGYWYARSADFMQQPLIDTLLWMRVPSDVVFSIGALALCWFFVGL